MVDVSLGTRSPWREVIAVPGEELRRDIIVPCQSGTIEVRVLDGVRYLPLGRARITCNGYDVGETDQSGSLSIAVVPNQWYEVGAQYERYCGRVRRVQSRSVPSSVPLELELSAAGVLSGKVIGRNGAPVSGASVVLVVIQDHKRPVVGGLVGTDSGEKRVSGAEGSFRFEDLGSPSGTTRLTVRVLAQSYARFESEPLEIPNGGEYGPIVCRLSDGLELKGMVTSHGQGIRATVGIEGSAETVPTDSYGRYQLSNVNASALSVCAFVDGHPDVRVCVGIEAPIMGMSHTDIRCEYRMERVVGTVSTHDKQPIANVEVRVEAATLDEEHPVVYSTRTNAAGAYSLELPVQDGRPDQRYTVRLQRWDENCAVADVRPPAVVDLTCEPSGTVSLSVVVSLSPS